MFNSKHFIVIINTAHGSWATCRFSLFVIIRSRGCSTDTVVFTSPLELNNQSSSLAAVRQELSGDEGDLVLWQPLVLKKVWQIIPKGSITCSWKRHKWSQFCPNFTQPKFQEDVMEHLGGRAHYTNLGSCTTKTLYLLKAPLHLLETLAV